MIIAILIGFVVLFIFLAFKSAKKRKKWLEEIQRDYGDLKEMIKMGALVSGHPNINERIDKCGGFIKNKEIHFFQYFDDQFSVEPKKIALISGAEISNILVEDQSTIEKRITVGRVLLTGVFALAWKKKKKNELSYLTVFWNDGRFDHETVFEFESKDSLSIANATRNKLISNI